jgi:Protein of unknown function (DUF3297)
MTCCAKPQPDKKVDCAMTTSKPNPNPVANSATNSATPSEIRAASASAASQPSLPDRLSVDAKSPFYNASVFEHEVGIRFNGVEKTTVEEYCISEGWIRVPAGKSLDRKGRPLMIKLKGLVEAFYK